MASTVDALLPLSLLEAVRDVDSPDDLDSEFVDELRNKRLGLSETVYLQIKRYSDAVRKKQRIPHEESVALARLIGRRPDAEGVFHAAGRYVAREAYRTIFAPTRKLLRVLPSFVARPLALRRTRRIASRYANGSVRRVGGYVLLDVPDSMTLNTAPGEIGCSYYEAMLRELLALMIGGVGSVDHIRCAGRGEGTCEWRADWKTFETHA
jgi:predicted hydrocarbon binding protein